MRSSRRPTSCSCTARRPERFRCSCGSGPARCAGYEVAVLRDLVELDRAAHAAASRRGHPGPAAAAARSCCRARCRARTWWTASTDVAAGFVAKRDEVISLLQVQEGQRTNQVLLKVRFAEVSRSALTELGMSLFTGPTGINNTLGPRHHAAVLRRPIHEDLDWTKASSRFRRRGRRGERASSRSATS